MNAKLAPTAKPPWAVTAWADDNAIYLELPSLDSHPYIMKFTLSDQGLSKAMWMMRDLYNQRRPEVSPIVETKLVRKIAPNRRKESKAGAKKPAYTAEQKARAMNVLKRLRGME